MKKHIFIISTIISLVLTTTNTSIKSVFAYDNSNEATTLEVTDKHVLYKDISFAQEDKVTEILEDSSLPIEILDSIKVKYNSIKELGLEDQINITINLTEGNAFVEDKNIVSTRGSSTSYHTYNNMQMKNYQVTYTNLSPGYQFIKKGTVAASYAESIKNVTLTLGNCALSSLSLVSFSTTLMQLFYDHVANFTVPRNTSDYIQLNFTYNLIDQWTYGMVGSSYQVGLYTQKATIKSADILQYYYNPSTQTGKSYTHHLSNLNKVLQSADFASPWAKTYSYAGNPWHEPISAKWGIYTFYF